MGGKVKSIPLRSIICGFAYFVFTFLLLLFVYIFDLFGTTVFLGVIYGVIVAVVMYCDTIKRTSIAMLMGLLSAIVSQLIVFFTGIPYRIIERIHIDVVQEFGRLTVNELIGYNWGIMLFWLGLVIALIASFIAALIIHSIKKHKHSLHNNTTANR